MVFRALATLAVTCAFVSDVQAGLPEGVAREIQHTTISRTSSAGSDYVAAAARTRIRYGFTDASNALSGGIHRRATPQEINVTASFGSNVYDTVYYTNVSIGTPAQHFLMALDTGFPDIWVAAPCDVFDCPTGMPLYNSRKSSTAVNKTAGQISLSEDQHLEGFIFTDTIRVGSQSISNAAFLSLGDSIMPVPPPCSGSMGLGFAPIGQTTNLPFWRAILEGKDISSPEFSYLDLVETNATYWALDISAVTVQGKSVSISKNRLAVFDTASAFLFAPKADMDAIWAAVPGSTLDTTSDFYQYPCDTDLNITVSFGGRTWPISPTALNLGPVSPGSQQCFGAIATSANTRDTVYSVFRQTPPSLGFAELSTIAGGSGPPNSSTPTSPSTQTSSSTSSSPSTSATSNTGGGKPGQKKNIGAIAGGVIAGLIVLLLAGVGFLLWRRRRNAKKLPKTPFSLTSGDEESMVVRPDPYPIIQSSFTVRTVSPKTGEKTTITHRFGDAPTSPVSSPQTDSEQGQEPQAHDGLTTGRVLSSQLPLGAQAPDLSQSTSDPNILQALESLREEVRQVRWLASEGAREEAPPGYATQ
ncbi:aspartic peptidase domain-containing protein [Mycena vulgaris]|nr:aspartic peptidase domain-containing protein [Mycena vulgaris]